MVRGTAVQDQTELVECVQEGIRGCKERPEPGAGKMAAEPHTLAGKPRNNIGRQGMRKERGQKRINNSKLAYSGLVPMLNTQIEAVNRGGSNKIPVPGTESTCQVPQDGAVPSALGSSERGLSREQKGLVTNRLCAADTQLILLQGEQNHRHPAQNPLWVVFHKWRALRQGSLM